MTRHIATAADLANIRACLATLAWIADGERNDEVVDDGVPGAWAPITAGMVRHALADLDAMAVGPSVASPDAVAALVKAARSVLSHDWDGRPMDDCTCDECSDLRALASALSHPAFKEIEEERSPKP